VPTTIETVGDNHAALVATLRRLLASHRLVLCTGGLGPTSDDMTATAAAEVAALPLVLNEDALSAIRRRLEERGVELLPGHRKQATLPDGAALLPNANGTASGFVIEVGDARAFFMPGVPAEMRVMFKQQVLERIRESATSDSYYVLLHTVGVGESWIEQQLEGFAAEFPDIELGYRAKSSEVDVRIVARNSDMAEARGMANAAAQSIRDRLGEAVYGEGEQTMPQIAGRAVRAKRWRLAVAESCTGGLIAQQLTSQPASDFFAGGAVAYENNAKTALLGVSEDTLRGHGAVSAEVAAEMADGARRVFGCEVAISVTGIAGPSGATADKPLGLCHWAVSHPGGTAVEHAVFSGNRNTVQKKAAHAALDLLRRTLRS
jgi:nicotinamide-nucleotide amidase